MSGWYRVSLLVLLGLVLLAGCKPETAGQGSGRYTITVNADGVSRLYSYNRPVSVGQFLQEVHITLGPDDEVNPLPQSQIWDGMQITVTRVEYRETCDPQELPYGDDIRYTHNLPPGERRVMSPGKAGSAQVCYRITIKNGEQTDRVQTGPPIVIEKPVNQVIFVGAEPPDTLLPIEGTLAFISGGQAMLIEGNTANMRPITQGSYLDGRVFDLSPDGRQLLYTVRTEDETDPEFSNRLWAILNTAAEQPEAFELIPDVRYAQWVPGKPYTLSYSTATPTTTGNGWQALNDLYLMQLDPETGAIVGVPEYLIQPNALGAYAYWGRRFAWSPDGTQLAWASADTVGIVDFEAKTTAEKFVSLLSFSEFATLLPAVWVPSLSWSGDGKLITTAHGEPYSTERPEDSIIFDMAVLDVVNGLQIKNFVPRSGIWSSPTYSPLVTGKDGNPATYIAYFQARETLNSLGSQYDLWVADSDGSNARRLFPPADEPGFRSPDPEDGIAWSPLGRQLAVIYQNNLYIIDVETGVAHQITSDGQASRPRWSRR